MLASRMTSVIVELGLIVLSHSRLTLLIKLLPSSRHVRPFLLPSWSVKCRNRAWSIETPPQDQRRDRDRLDAIPIGARHLLLELQRQRWPAAGPQDQFVIAVDQIRCHLTRIAIDFDGLLSMKLRIRIRVISGHRIGICAILQSIGRISDRSDSCARRSARTVGGIGPGKRRPPSDAAPRNVGPSAVQPRQRAARGRALRGPQNVYHAPPARNRCLYSAAINKFPFMACFSQHDAPVTADNWQPTV